MKALLAIVLLVVPMVCVGQIHIDSGAREMLASPDIAFLLQAEQSGLANIRFGKLAAERGATPGLRQFGAQIAEQYSQMRGKLDSIASRNRMVLPNVISAKDQATYNTLTKLSGAAFDKVYAKRLLKMQKAAAKRFAKEAKKGRKEPVRDFASEALPILEQHVDQLKSLESQSS